MNAHELAIFNTNLGPRVRVALDVIKNPEMPDRWELHKLQGETEGNFANVYSGSAIWSGQKAKQCALKVQRDTALSKDLSQVVDVKFDMEMMLHQRLADQRDRGTVGVVSMYSLTESQSQVAEVIPPLILCQKAPHALVPLCPKCARPLRTDNFVANDDDRRLECDNPSCVTSSTTDKSTRRFAKNDANKKLIITATVQNSDACQDCPHRHDPVDKCVSKSIFLNYFPSKVLAFEKLDFDLSQYIAWGKPTLTVQPSQKFVKSKFDHYVAENTKADKRTEEIAGDPVLNQLERICDIYSCVLEGVERIHALPGAHLDLKPENICILLRGDKAIAKVIDLGLSIDRKNEELLRKLPSEQLDLGCFAAPEVGRSQQREYLYTAGQLDSDSLFSLRLIEKPLTNDFLIDSPIVPGDWAKIISGHQQIEGEVVQIDSASANWKLQIRVAKSNVQPSADGKLAIHKVAGPAADVYSLGLLLIALLINRRDLDQLRQDFVSLANHFSRHHPDVQLPWRTQLTKLLQSRNSDTSHFALLSQVFPTTERLNNSSISATLAQELFAISLRCCIRGIPNFSFVMNRASGRDVAPQQPGPVQLIKDEIQRIRRAIHMLQQHFIRKHSLEKIYHVTNKLLDKPVLTGSSQSKVKSSDVPFDAGHFWPVLLLGGDHEKQALRLLYDNNTQLLQEHLKRFQRSLLPNEMKSESVPVISLPQAAVLQQDIVPITDLVPLCRYICMLRYDYNTSKTWTQCLNNLVRKQKDISPLRSMKLKLDGAIKSLAALVDSLASTLYLDSLSTAKDTVSIKLLRTTRDQIQADDVIKALDALTELLNDAKKLVKKRNAAMFASIEHLKKLDYAIRSVMQPQVIDDDRVKAWKACKSWCDQSENAVRVITAFVTHFQDRILPKWQETLDTKSVIQRVFGTSPKITLTLDVTTWNRAGFLAAKQALDALTDSGVGPVLTLEAIAMDVESDSQSQSIQVIN